MWFLLDLQPTPWVVGPVGSARKGGKLTSFVGRDQGLYAYQEAVKEEIATQLPDDFQMLRNRRLELRFYFWRNLEEYQTHQARAARNHEADLTNMVKATEDAMQGLVYKNDKDVVEQHNYIVEQGPDVHSRVLIYVGIARDYYPPDELPIEAKAVLWPDTVTAVQVTDASEVFLSDAEEPMF